MFNDSASSKKTDFTAKRPKQAEAQPTPKAGQVSNVFAIAGIYLYKSCVFLHLFILKINWTHYKRDAKGELVLASEAALGAALLFDQSRYFLYIYKTKSEPILSLYFNSKFTLDVCNYFFLIKFKKRLYMIERCNFVLIN